MADAPGNSGTAPMAPGASLSHALSEARPLVMAALASHLRDLDAAQEAFAEACIALTQSETVPENLAAWLIAVGKRKAVDAIRRREAQARAADSAAYLEHPEGSDMGEVIELPEPITDERLRLIFICCHPALALEARAALALKVICGLPVEAIARLFLTTEPTMYQRITRAKTKIREAQVEFELPPRRVWGERLEAVLLTLELAYTVAYQDAGGTQPVNEGGELAEEVERLARMLVELLPQEPEVLGIAALVTLARSREAARIDRDGAMVPLSEQDTAQWDRQRIEQARQWLDQASAGQQTGPYQIMAAIQLTHARRLFDGTVDWRAVLALYNALEMVRPGPMVALNRIMALAEVEGAQASLNELADLPAGRLSSTRPFHVACARLLETSGRTFDALEALDKALALDPSQAERRYLERWRARLS
ncbi:MAG: DUF6596 domain-containing protein [Pseudomonadota bacterium]